MRTMNIFKTLALAMLMPTMLLTTACSSEDDVANTSNITSKGYALPVTVNVTREDGATRATYNESTRKLSFSAGDKLFVRAMSSPAGKFAGLLDYDSETGKFSGTIMTQNDYSGTAEALLAATSPSATLIPAGYDSYSYLTIEDEGTYGADLDYHIGKAFALTKATAVEQFSLESASSYSSGFALAPQNAIVSFTISGLTANTAVAVLFKDNYDISATPVDVTTDASGVATFAVGMYDYANFDNYSLTVGGNAIALPAAKNVVAGHIYNISRSAASATDLSTLPAGVYEAQNGETLTGTLANNVEISIADGATVTLKDVNITNLGDDCNWAGINCEGDATLVLEGTNEVCAGRDQYGDNNYPGIGGGEYASCGNITISGGTVSATVGDCAAGIGGGRNDGDYGNSTSGVTSVTATKGSGAPNSIGRGENGTAITVTIEDPSKVTQN